MRYTGRSHPVRPFPSRHAALHTPVKRRERPATAPLKLGTGTQPLLPVASDIHNRNASKGTLLAEVRWHVCRGEPPPGFVPNSREIPSSLVHDKSGASPPGAPLICLWARRDSRDFTEHFASIALVLHELPAGRRQPARSSPAMPMGVRTSPD